MKKKKIEKVIMASTLGLIASVLLPNANLAITDQNSAISPNFTYTRTVEETLTTEAEQSSGPITAYQMSLTVDMNDEANKKLDSSIAQYRTYYGCDERIHFRVNFDGATIRNHGTVTPKLVISFGEGSDIAINTGLSNPNSEDGYFIVVNKSYIDFYYTIRERDIGELKIKSLTGQVIDQNGHTVNMAKPDHLQLQNPIYAFGKVMEKQPDEENWGQTSEGGSYIGLYPGYQGNEENENFTADDDFGKLEENFRKLYYYDENTKTIQELTKAKIKIFSNDYNVTNANTANVDIYENGIRVHPNITGFYVKVCDIAGNACDLYYGELAHVESVTAEEYDIYDGSDNDNVKNNMAGLKNKDSINRYYLKVGKKVTVTVKNITSEGSMDYWFGERVNEGQSGDNCKESNKSRNGYIDTYTCTVADGENGEFNYSVGGNSDGSTTLGIEKREDIIAKTTNPTFTLNGVGESTENKKTSGTSYVKRTTGSIYDFYTASDDMFAICIEQKIEDELQDTINQNKKTEPNTEWYSKYQYNRSNEGHSVNTYYVSDIAGNIITATNSGVSVYVDGTGPRVSLEETKFINSNTFTVDITPSDPKILEKYNGSGVKSAVTQNRVNVTNGNIIKYTTNENKVATVTIMPVMDGPVGVYVLPNACEDNVGNTSTESGVQTYFVDRTAPVIHNVTGVPDNWVESAKLTVNATDAGGNAIQYRFGTSKNGNEVVWENSETDNGWKSDNTFIVRENGTVYIQVKDSLGNESKIMEQSIDKIDDGTPTISSVEYNGNWTNQDVTVTIYASSNKSPISQYSFDGGSSWTTSPSKPYYESTQITPDKIQVKNTAGKVGTYGTEDDTDKTINIQIDTTLPTMMTSLSPSTDAYGPVTLTVTPSDEGGSGIASVTVNGENVTGDNGTYTKVITQNGSYEIVVRDNAGNGARQTENINTIKEFNPTITCENNGGVYVRPSDNSATHIRPIINVQGETNPKIYYKLSAEETTPTEEWKQATGNRLELDEMVNETGTYYLHVKVERYEGDQNPATFQSSAFEVKKSSITLTADNLNLTNQNVVVTADYGEGLTENRKMGIENNLSANTNQVVLSENGTVHAEATDKAGNKVSADLSVTIIDKIAPSISAVTKSTEDWTNGNVTITVNASDEQSGLAEQAYSFDGGETWQAENTKEYNENTRNIQIQVKDSVGNISQYNQSIEITNIDKTEPEINTGSIIQTTVTDRNNSEQYIAELSTTITITEENLKNVEYVWTNTEEPPTNYDGQSKEKTIAIKKENITEARTMVSTYKSNG